jgi:hypothetical protein
MKKYKVVQITTRYVTTEVEAVSKKNAERKFWWSQTASDPKIRYERSMEVLECQSSEIS